MKKILFVFIILLFNCHNAQNTGEMKIQQIPLEKQITYGISLSMRVPYELYINDIKADYDYVGANSGVDMNPYILKNGKYKVKLRIFPAFKAGEKLIVSKDIKNSNISFDSYIRNKETDEILNYNSIPLPIVAPKEDVPYFEQEWDVELTELPYELEGWSKGQDLRKWDKKENERIVYALDVTIPGRYEAYINDILVETNNEMSMHNTIININQAVLKSGTYQFRIKLFSSNEELRKGGIQPDTFQFLKVGLVKYQKIAVGEGAEEGTYQYLYSYPIPNLEKPVPYYEIKGKFTIDLPYELNGWSNGQDLRKWDKDKLKKKVIAYYKKLWEILNKGDVDQWQKLVKKSQEETAFFNYSDKEYLNKYIKEEKEEIIKDKGMMAALEDYEMKIYADGRLVCLERSNHTKQVNGIDWDIKGESPLIQYGKEGGAATFPVKLYLPQGSDEFVIIRRY